MNKSLKTILAVAVFGGATWVAAMLSGQLIVLITGVPASSGLINGFLVPFLLVLGYRTVPIRWYMATAFTVYGALAVPTVLLGPPGVHKVAVALIAGLAADLACQALSRSDKMYHAAPVLALMIWALVLVALARAVFEIDALNLPGKEKFIAAFPAMAVVFIVGAVVGASLASILFDRRRLNERPIIVRLRTWIEM